MQGSVVKAGHPNLLLPISSLQKRRKNNPQIASCRRQKASPLSVSCRGPWLHPPLPTLPLPLLGIIFRRKDRTAFVALSSPTSPWVFPPAEMGHGFPQCFDLGLPGLTVHVGEGVGENEKGCLTLTAEPRMYLRGSVVWGQILRGVQRRIKPAAAIAHSGWVQLFKYI